MRRLDGIIDSMDKNLSKLWGVVEDRGAWRAAVHGVRKGLTQPSDSKTTTTKRSKACSLALGTVFHAGVGPGRVVVRTGYFFLSEKSCHTSI